jgi:hypothetical protein
MAVKIISAHEETSVFFGLFDIKIVNEETAKNIPEVITIMNSILDLKLDYAYPSQPNVYNYILQIQEKIKYTVYLQVCVNFLNNMEKCYLIFRPINLSIDEVFMAIELAPIENLRITKKEGDILKKFRYNLLSPEYKFVMNELTNMMVGLMKKKKIES